MFCNAVLQADQWSVKIQVLTRMARDYNGSEP